MKSCKFHNNPLWDNTTNLTKLNQLNNYKSWLELRNFSIVSLEKFLRNLKYFGEAEITTSSVVNFLRENLIKFEPNTLRGQSNTFASYCKFLKAHHQIEWDVINRIIPIVQKKPFATLAEEEFEKLVLTDTKTDKLTKERNNLIAQFFWYISMRVSELIKIRHNHYSQGLLKLHVKGIESERLLCLNF